jgi:hypothetical protein
VRQLALSLAIIGVFAARALAAPGDVWTLGIHHIDQSNLFTTFPGAGYSGPRSSGNASFSGNSYGFSGKDGVARVYWELSGNSTNNDTPVPTTTELYSIEFFGTTDVGHNQWQPIESQIRGVNGEMWPTEPMIPWNGQFGTNHQWMASTGTNSGQWHPVGPGPQSPESSSPTASGNGSYMWLTAGAWLYAKWDFTGSTDRSWSAIRLKQITPILGPPPDGDYNGNGTVDTADYVVWRDELGQLNPALLSDGFEDGFIDEYDYYFWEERFGNTSSSGAAGMQSLGAVPEPAGLLLRLSIVAACLTWRRGNRLSNAFKKRHS